MLKARNAIRAKTASVAEKGKEKAANECGDFAAVKELRQKMFEQQRQYVWSTCLVAYLRFLFNLPISLGLGCDRPAPPNVNL